MDFPYLQLFEKDNYTLDKWNDVEDLPKIESGYYDIILLDIQGVGGDYSQEQGFGILKHLRKVCPVQIVIAYSNADFSLKYQDFFQMADGILAKSDDYVEFKRTVDKLLRERFSLGFYVDRVTKLASPFLSDTDKLKTLTSRAILRNNNKKLKSYLNRHIENKESISLILQIVEVGLTIVAL